MWLINSNYIHTLFIQCVDRILFWRGYKMSRQYPYWNLYWPHCSILNLGVLASLRISFTSKLLCSVGGVIKKIAIQLINNLSESPPQSLKHARVALFLLPPNITFLLYNFAIGPFARSLPFMGNKWNAIIFMNEKWLGKLILLSITKV